jgi:putative ABC transport system substrate-binding protein
MKLAGLVLLGVLGLTSPVPLAVAQPATKQVTLGVLVAAGTTPNPALIAALRDLGYQQGRNLTIEFRSANGRNEELPRLAAELVALSPDVIVTIGTPPGLAAKRATGSIPIVILGVGDPVGFGLVESLAHPGANVTGRSNASYEVSAKRWQLMAETLPGMCCVTVLRNPSNPGNLAPPSGGRGGRPAAETLGIETKVIDAATADQLDQVLAAPFDDRFKALLILADALFAAQRVQIAEAARRRGLAVFGSSPEDAAAGFLEAYGINAANESAASAVYVDKILKGAKPADLPVELPTRFTLVVNLKTAKALGITIPPLIFSRADEVIE